MGLRRKYEKRCFWRIYGRQRHAMLHGVAPWNLDKLECMHPRISKKTMEDLMVEVYMHIFREERKNG